MVALKSGVQFRLAGRLPGFAGRAAEHGDTSRHFDGFCVSMPATGRRAVRCNRSRVPPKPAFGRMPGLKRTAFHPLSDLLEKTCFAKSSKKSPLLDSEPGNRSKKQLGISRNLRFLLIHGAHPLSCFVGCRGQSIFLHEQNGLMLFMLTPELFVYPQAGWSPVPCLPGSRFQGAAALQ